MANVIQGEKQYIDAFLRLTLKPTSAADVFPLLKSLTLQQRQEFVELADANHVVVRAFEAINRIAGNLGNHDIQAWAVSVLTGERERITTALSRLEQVCDALEDAQCATVVMKTLDHLPDLGNDLDVVVVGDRKNVLQVFTRTFNAKVEARSWGDRLANKWNFVLPGLRESIEAHIGRLGQMGEHKRLAQRFIGRRVRVNINGNRFFMPAHEERIYAATLQRMYRHFYFRVCDIVNAAAVVNSGKLDFASCAYPCYRTPQSYTHASSKKRLSVATFRQLCGSACFHLSPRLRLWLSRSPVATKEFGKKHPGCPNYVEYRFSSQSLTLFHSGLEW